MAPLNMSCGQTDLHPDVLAALGTQLGTPIYYPPYWQTEVEATDLLQRLLGTRHDILLLVGTATYGEEAAMLSLLEPGDKVVTINTGTFGQVLTDLARLAGAEVVEIRLPEGQAVTAEQVADTMAQHRDAAMVACVQVETSAGTVNPVAQIGQVLRAYPRTLFLVDGVSGFACVDTQVDAWGIDVYCTSSQKCVNAPQGVAVVAVGPRAWGKVASRTRPIPSVCLDLTVWRRYHQGVRAAVTPGGKQEDVSFQAGARIAHGPSCSYVLTKGLLHALRAIEREGMDRVVRRHYVAGRSVREGIRGMGVLGLLADEAVAAPCATRILWPEDLDVPALNQALWREEGIALAGRRIGTMGVSARREPVLRTLDALGRMLRSMGYPVDPEEAVRRADAVWQKEGADLAGI